MKPYNDPPIIDFIRDCGARIKRAFLLILGVPIVLATCLMLVGGLQVWVVCSQWPKTEARVTRFELAKDPADRRSMLVDLTYEFLIQGNRETGTQLSPFITDNKTHRWLARWKQSRYPVGSTTQVIYNPKDVETSFLERPVLAECLLRCLFLGGIGAWMVYLSFRFRRRTVPGEVLDMMNRRKSLEPSDVPHYDGPIMIRGISSHTPLGSLFSSWPRCKVALVVSQTQFAVIQGPYTKRGLASSLLTLFFLLWFNSFWSLITHVLYDIKEVFFRYLNWNSLCTAQFNDLGGADSIDRIVLYGLDPRTNRLWYRVERRQRDEFIEVAQNDVQVAEYFVNVADEHRRNFDETS